MYYRPVRTLFGLIAVGGAIAVGIITRDAGFTALTFIGGLLLPRILGIRTRRFGARGCGVAGGPGNRQLRGQLEQRMESWHRQAHGDSAADQAASSPTGA